MMSERLFFGGDINSAAYSSFVRNLLGKSAFYDFNFFYVCGVYCGKIERSVLGVVYANSVYDDADCFICKSTDGRF